MSFFIRGKNRPECAAVRNAGNLVKLASKSLESARKTPMKPLQK
jgi:hypothetical protein